MLFGNSARTRTIAEAAARQGDTDKAIKLYQKVLRKTPGDLKARKILGDLLESKGCIAEAVACFELLASQYAEQGLLFRAISSCRKILELDSEHVTTQNTLANLYAQQGKGPQMGSTTTMSDDDEEVADDALEVLAEDFGGDDDVEITDSGLEVLSATVVTDDVQEAEDLVEEEDVKDDDEGTVDLDFDCEDLVVGAAEVDAQRHQQTRFTADNPPPLFAKLPPAAFETLVNRLQLWEVPAQTQVLTQGDAGDSFFIIAAGQVRVERDIPGEEREEVATLREGDFFGEIAILARHPRTAHVVTETYTELLEVSRQVIDELIAEHPQVEAVLQQFANERLVRNVLRTSPLFSGLSEEAALNAIAAFKPLAVGMGQTVIAQGGESTGLHVIAQGEIEVSSTDDGYTHLAQLHEGEVFGEISLYFDEPATANCTALRDTTLLTLSAEEFKTFIKKNPSVEKQLHQLCDARTQSDATHNALADHRNSLLA